MSRLILALMLLAFLSSTLTAQTGEIRGKVIDMENDGEPLPFASVHLRNTEGVVKTTKTDSLGKYSFSNIKGFNLTIWAEYLGYPPSCTNTFFVLKDVVTNISTFQMHSDYVEIEYFENTTEVKKEEKELQTLFGQVSAFKSKNKKTKNIRPKLKGGVKVQLVSNIDTLTAYTNDDGVFKFDSLSANTYYIVFSKSHYLPLIVRNINVYDKTTEVNVGIYEPKTVLPERETNKTTQCGCCIDEVIIFIKREDFMKNTSLKDYRELISTTPGIFAPF